MTLQFLMSLAVLRIMSDREIHFPTEYFLVSPEVFFFLKFLLVIYFHRLLYLQLRISWFGHVSLHEYMRYLFSASGTFHTGS